MSRNCSIDELADVINEGLKEYAELSASQVKSAVRKTARTVRGEIESGAPVRTGQYAKSWKVKTTEENSQKLVQTVYSPTRYMLAHLLEKGHAKRGGGRVAGKPHIAPAEAAGVKQLESLIEKALKGWTNFDIPKTDKRAYMDNEISTIVESWYAWMCF